MSRIILVGCGKKKLNRRDTAADLYTGSFFGARRKFAEGSGDRWFIISAKYGLVEPTSLVDPYDLKITDLSVLDRAAWCLSVVHSLIDTLPNAIDTTKLLREVVVEAHAGADYSEGLRDVVLAAGMSFSWPVKGMSQGEQMRYYSSQVLCQSSTRGAAKA